MVALSYLNDYSFAIGLIKTCQCLQIFFKEEYELFGEGSHILTNQMRQKGASSLLIG